MNVGELKGKILFAKIDYMTKTRDGLCLMLNTQLSKKPLNTNALKILSNDIDKAEIQIKDSFTKLEKLCDELDKNGD